MADLPGSRVLAEKPPFTSAGVDYFGPFRVGRGWSLVKRYGVIFTCLATRAVHLEIAHSLSTDSFLLALWRFIARRGQLKQIYSDNGSNVTGGEKEQRDAISDWNQEKIHNFLLQITSTGSSALRMVLTLEVFGRDASEPFGRFYKPPAARANYLWRKSGHLNVRSREYHEQSTHYHRVQWSKRQWALDAQPPVVAQNISLLTPRLFKRLYVASSIEASTILSGHLLEEIEQGAPSPFAAETKVGAPKEELGRLWYRCGHRFLSRIAIPGRLPEFLKPSLTKEALFAEWKCSPRQLLTKDPSTSSAFWLKTNVQAQETWH